MTRLIAPLILAFATSGLLAQPGTRPTTAPTGDDGDHPTIILVVGAAGETEFGRDFAKAADHWTDAAKLASAHLIQIGRDESSSRDASDKDRLKQSLATEVQRPATAPTLWIVLIGHGTFDGKEAKFNLRGPDVSDQELAQWLEPCHRPLAVIDCSSSSAPFLNRLSAPNRIVVTATQSGHELQYARFGAYLAADIADPAADLDKDGQTSLLEAFLAASHQVESFYKEQGRLATEHALLDDNGDARGTPATFFQGVRATRAARDGATPDGLRAHQLHLVLSPTDAAMSQEARARRDDLERQVESLRGKKATTPQADYYAALEKLLLQLAGVYDKMPATRPRP
ncbi:MAG: hypothetical protein JWN40_1226 [Phycisphaerales bacterium]|nr:hypothetical protein [Phycisphaerales bacterium]